MIADARQSKPPFQAILVHKFDRFSRSRADHVIYKALLKKQGIFVLSATEKTEPETLKGMRENATQGFHCGGRAPFGYRLVRTGSKVNYEYGPEEEVNIIRQIFNMAADGMGGKRMARLLNEQAGRKWTPSTVLSILSNHAYLGYRTWNKKSEVNGHKNPPSEWILSKDSHPAIITEKQWAAAQSMLSARRAYHYKQVTQ